MRSTLLRAIALVSLIALAAATSVGVVEAAGATITVNGTGDSNARDGVLTLREAILLATGGLTVATLDSGECAKVSSSTYAGTCSTTDTIGSASSDTIKFDTGVFPSGSPAAIALDSELPALHTNNDTVDGSLGPAGVIVSGGYQGFSCFTVSSNSNFIRGLRVQECWTGIGIEGGAQSNTIGGTGNNQRNVIVDNSQGIGIYDSGTSGNLIVGNHIGVIDGAPPSSHPNSTGIDIGNGAGNNTIGGTTTAHRNVIAASWGPGVNIWSSSGNTIIGNYIGTSPDGTSAMGNWAGVALSDTTSNVIGGSTADERNVISGNGWAGVAIYGSASWGNQITGNYIGTNYDATSGLGGQEGLQITGGAHDNVIGGASAGQMNVISGNGQQGVRIEGSGTSYNRVIGNRIGTNLSGTAFLGNSNEGVLIQGGAWANTVGGWTAGEGNLISGNNGGVGIRDAGTFGNRVINNRIGTDAGGTSPLGNTWAGVGVQYGAENTTIAGNLISGNNGNGVQIEGSGSSGNTVSGNLIGTKLSGNEVLPNNNSGVWIWNAENNSVIGSNVISGNNGGGVQVSGSGSYGNVVQGNRIGLMADGSGTLGNGWSSGVSLDQGAHDNTVGSGNVISGNNTGVSIQNSGTRNNLVTGNNIGTNIDGDAAMPNNTGVDISNGAQDNTVGGTGMGSGNVISGNNSYGLAIHDGGTSGNTVVWNWIGTTSDNSAPLPNGDGVALWWTQDNTIGPSNLISGNNYNGLAFYGGTSGNRVISNLIGTDLGGYGSIPNGTGVSAFGGDASDTVGGAGAGNLISGNNGAGVVIWSSGLKVLDNLIGTNRSGAGPLSNGGPGVEVTWGCAWHNVIGRPGEGNVIAFNGGDGVRVEGGCAVFDTIRVNSIHSNSGMGIENFNGGNWEIPPPNIFSQNPIKGTTCPNCTVDIYTDYEDEGRYYEGSVVAGVGGNFTFSDGLFGPWLTATTTDPSGSTSEFSAPIPVADTGDNDSDGVLNYQDACPSVPEDIDGYNDADGCPDPDNDGDGFPDSTDQCPATDSIVGNDHVPCTNDLNEINTCEDYDGVLDTDGCHDSPGEDLDGDTLPDDDEVHTYLTRPDIADTDGDGLSDGEEVLTYNTCPADGANLPQCAGVADARDTDGGGVSDGDEVGRGTNPLDPGDDAAAGDIDSDGIPDGEDNCPSTYNPGQLNTDSACIDNGTSITGSCRGNPDKDSLGDACDLDDDNDDLTDAQEAAGCGSFGPTEPLKKDTDGDRAIDGYECKMSKDPNNPAVRPYCAGSTDTDGDGIFDCVEEMGWGTSPSSTDTDGDSSGSDGCQDDKQIVDVNGDGQANVLDVMAVARIAFTAGPFDPVSRAAADIDKDGTNGVLDVMLAAKNSSLVEPHTSC
jgi:hypothetical protein